MNLILIVVLAFLALHSQADAASIVPPNGGQPCPYGCDASEALHPA